MRQLWIHAPSEQHERLADVIERSAERTSTPQRMIVADVANDKLDSLLHDLEQFDGVEVTYAPTSTVFLRSPITDLGKHIRHISRVSVLEIYVRAIQSISSWRGFLAYAAISGCMVWMALLINSPFVLVAGILISPFAGPAMTAGIGTSIGDRRVILSGVTRYCAGLAVGIGTATLLSLLVGLKAVTPMMLDTSNRSSVSIIAPIAAGLVGALHLLLSERNSLVPTAAVGATVAATLGPPAGIVGMSVVVGRWDLALDSLFFLALQLFAINAAAGLVFWFAGLRPGAAAYYDGKRGVTAVSALVTAAALTALIGMQYANSPALQRASRSQAAIPVVERAIQNSGIAHTLQVKASFPRPSPTQGSALMVEASVYRDPAALVDDADFRAALARRIKKALSESGFQVEPYVIVNVAAASP